MFNSSENLMKSLLEHKYILLFYEKIFTCAPSMADTIMCNNSELPRDWLWNCLKKTINIKPTFNIYFSRQTKIINMDCLYFIFYIIVRISLATTLCICQLTNQSSILYDFYLVKFMTVMQNTLSRNSNFIIGIQFLLQTS